LEVLSLTVTLNNCADIVKGPLGRNFWWHLGRISTYTTLCTWIQEEEPEWSTVEKKSWGRQNIRIHYREEKMRH
jgi:hypothetical protein